MLALILVALSLGLSNFAAAIGIGIPGTSARTRLKAGIISGLFEPACRSPTMPGLEALGQSFHVVDTSPLDPSVKISPLIGAASGLEFMPGGRVLAAAEPVRRGGGSAGVVNPSG